MTAPQDARAVVAPAAEAGNPWASALLAVLDEHAPGERNGRSVDSTRCPDHNPKDHPDLFGGVLDHDVFDACPTCVTGEYEVCSSWSCTGCGWPCDTVEVVESALILVGLLPKPHAA